MDLSNLSNNLPPTSPITEESIQELSNEITTNFKDAAKSVLALYRLSQSKNSLLISKGYLDCINDLLKVISNGDDVEDWALMRKNELSRMNKSDTAEIKSVNKDIQDNEEDGEIPEQNEEELKKIFKMNNVSPAPFKFPPSMIPLSLNHANVQHYFPRTKKIVKSSNDVEQSQDTSEEDEEIVFDDNKRRILGMNNGNTDKKSRFR